MCVVLVEFRPPRRNSDRGQHRSRRLSAETAIEVSTVLAASALKTAMEGSTVLAASALNTTMEIHKDLVLTVVLVAGTHA